MDQDAGGKLSSLVDLFLKTESHTLKEGVHTDCQYQHNCRGFADCDVVLWLLLFWLYKLSGRVCTWSCRFLSNFGLSHCHLNIAILGIRSTRALSLSLSATVTMASLDVKFLCNDSIYEKYEDVSHEKAYIRQRERPLDAFMFGPPIVDLDCFGHHVGQRHSQEQA